MSAAAYRNCEACRTTGWAYGRVCHRCAGEGYLRVGPPAARNGRNGHTPRGQLPPAERAQLALADADPTFRRVRAVCSAFSAPSVDLEAHAAQVTLTVHRARAAS